MRITEDIRMAIMTAAVKFDSIRHFAQVVGINQATMHKYVHGKFKVIRVHTWAKLAPYLAPYLPEDALPPVPAATTRIDYSRRGAALMANPEVMERAAAAAERFADALDRIAGSVGPILAAAKELERKN